jgi:hypothetical protein
MQYLDSSLLSFWEEDERIDLAKMNILVLLGKSIFRLKMGSKIRSMVQRECEAWMTKSMLGQGASLPATSPFRLLITLIKCKG